MLIDDDIDEIIWWGEERIKEINSKYVGFDFDVLNNFKFESLVNIWEGEDYGNRVSFIYYVCWNDVVNIWLVIKMFFFLDWVF